MSASFIKCLLFTNCINMKLLFFFVLFGFFFSLSFSTSISTLLRERRKEDNLTTLRALLGCSADNLYCPTAFLELLPESLVVVPSRICVSARHIQEIMFLPRVNCVVEDVFTRRSKVGWENYECIFYAASGLPDLPRTCRNYVAYTINGSGVIIMGTAEKEFPKTLVGSRRRNYLCLDGEKYFIFDKVDDYLTGEFKDESFLSSVKVQGDEVGFELFDYTLLDSILDPKDKNQNFHVPSNCFNNVQEICLPRQSQYFLAQGPRFLGRTVINKMHCERGYTFFNTTHEVCSDYFIHGENVCSRHIFMEVHPRTYYRYGVVMASDSNPILEAPKFSNLTIRINKTYFSLNEMKKDFFDNLKSSMPTRLNVVIPDFNYTQKEQARAFDRLFGKYKSLDDNFKMFLNKTFDNVIDKFASSFKPVNFVGVGGFFDWFYNVMEALIRPFVKAFEEMLTAVLKLFIDLAVKAIREVLYFLVELVKESAVLLKALLAAIEEVVESLLPVLNDLFGTLSKTLTDLFVEIDKSYRLLEYVILSVLLSIYVVNNNTMVALLTLIVSVHFGLSRNKGEDSLLQASLNLLNTTH